MPASPTPKLPRTTRFDAVVMRSRSLRGYQLLQLASAALLAVPLACLTRAAWETWAVGSAVFLLLLSVTILRRPMTAEAARRKESVRVGVDGVRIADQFFELDDVLLFPIRRAFRAAGTEVAFASRESYDEFESALVERRRWRSTLEASDAVPESYRGGRVRVELNWREELVVHAEREESDVEEFLAEKG